MNKHEIAESSACPGATSMKLKTAFQIPRGRTLPVSLWTRPRAAAISMSPSTRRQVSRVRIALSVTNPRSACCSGTVSTPVQKSTNPEIRCPGGFNLTRGLGVWELSHGNERAVLKHKIASNTLPSFSPIRTRISAALKALKIRAAREGMPGRDDMIQERALALDDAEAALCLYDNPLQIGLIARL